MSNRIDQRFGALAAEGRKALIPFVTAGYPEPEWTVPVLHALVAAGADILELGVPFSDPTADGPVIQSASERAIERGVSIAVVLDMVRQFREEDTLTPIVLMGYMNPIERYGSAEFALDAAAAGVDGVLLVDCPPEEMGRLRDDFGRHGIHPICLVAPTTTEARMAAIAGRAGGYLYYVSFKGITGADRLDAAALAAPLERLRRQSDLPLAVGFGIKGPQSAAAVSPLADGVVIGSALIEALGTADSVAAACTAVGGFLAPVREAMDNNSP